MANDDAWEDLERIFPGTADAELPMYQYPGQAGFRVGPLVPTQRWVVTGQQQATRGES
jgi:hypothetical protein